MDRFVFNIFFYSPELPDEKSVMQQQQQQYSSDFENVTTQSVSNVMLFPQVHPELEKNQGPYQSQLHSHLQSQQTRLQKQQQIISGSGHCRGSAAVTPLMPVTSGWTSCITPLLPSTQNTSANRLSGEEEVQVDRVEKGLNQSTEYRLVSFDVFTICTTE